MAKRNKIGSFRWTVLIGFALSFSLEAQQMVTVNDSIDERNFMPYELMYFNDTTNRLSFEQASSREFTQKFQQHTSYQNKDFVANSAYWIRLPIQHSTATQKVWLLEFYDQTIDHIDAYIPQIDGSYKLTKLGDSQNFIKRFFRHKNFELMLNMKRDTLMYYYFRIRSHEFADIRIAFRSANRFVYYAENEYFLFGTFYGMILIITLYNFLVYLAIREIKFIYYIFYILSVALYAMSLDGIGFQYLWPGNPELNNIATGVTLYAVILWALIFTRRFLSLAANAPQLDAIFKWMILARTLLFFFALTFSPSLFAYRNIEIVPLSLVFYGAIRVWQNGYRPARFFVIAYGVLFSGFFLRGLVTFNVLPFTIITHYSLHFSFVLEMLFLTLALGDRIRILKDNKDRALRRIIHQHEVNMRLQGKVNRELEQKVKERTLQLNKKNGELEESNDKLVRQADEINQINSLLDLDNWKLKNRVKEVLNEMLMEKTMTYSEFKMLYPDTLTCQRFLEGLKWGEEFHCRKCGNEKYFEGSQKFSRRCTRCGYNESVTAFTIFQSIKFPIEKAFYIAYLGVGSKTQTTLEALSQQLDLSSNTVWAFRSKVVQSKKELLNVGKRITASRWDEIILYSEKVHTKVKSSMSRAS